MQTTNQFLDAVMKKNGITSDNQLSIYLGCTRSAVSGYRHNKTCLDDEIACKVAADLGLDTSYVLACIASERAKKPEVKAAWKHAAELLYGVAAIVALACVLPLPFIHLSNVTPLNAAILGTTAFDNNVLYTSVIYIIRTSAEYWWLIIPLTIIAFHFFPKGKRDDTATP